MAYNSFFPVGYQPMQMYYPQQNPVQGTQMSVANQPQNTGIIWVQGEAGAKSYLVAPNQSVPLWDSESQTIYIKSADASGMPSIRVIDYTFRENPAQKAQNAPESGFATKEEVDTLRQDLMVLRANYEAMKGAKE